MQQASRACLFVAFLRGRSARPHVRHDEARARTIGLALICRSLELVRQQSRSFCGRGVALVLERAIVFPTSLEAVCRRISRAMPLFDQNNATAVAVQRTRLLADWLRSYVGLVPTWRAEYFDRGRGQTPRSVFIVAENVSVAVEEVRARRAPTCARAKITKLNLDLETIIVL